MDPIVHIKDNLVVLAYKIINSILISRIEPADLIKHPLSCINRMDLLLKQAYFYLGRNQLLHFTGVSLTSEKRTVMAKLPGKFALQ
jgi:accessory gene regulator protein AgrB